MKHTLYKDRKIRTVMVPAVDDVRPLKPDDIFSDAFDGTPIFGAMIVDINVEEVDVVVTGE